MRIPSLMTDLQFVGEAQGDRRSYYVFKNKSQYLVVSPSGRNGFNASVVEGEAPDVILRRFAGERITSTDLRTGSRRPDLFEAPFDRLNALYVMVALGKARKLKKRDGRSMVFKIAAS